ncbi:hypothetical protein KVT40_000946 [Elsinoe batatas]|uniref:IgE-binding protein n=1 Tax=Elsinoe batatas TaxID=2601811 RepID=A0A8K0LC71_9PEZI|nr:hypothetical protein KVT40_000946 [Elsinoe batatas]
MHLSTITSILTLAALGTAVPLDMEKRQNQQPPFTLIASRPNSPIDSLKIQAAGQRFFLGIQSPSSYCPVQVGSSCPKTTDTVLLNGAMYAMVPGGQATFVQKSGALAYTQAHSSFRPDYFSSDLAAYSDGSYRGPSGANFAACPVQGQPGQWQVFAETPGFTGQNCLCFQAKWQKWTGGIGAWQYT